MASAKYYIKQRSVQTDGDWETVSRAVETRDNDDELQKGLRTRQSPAVVIFGSGPGAVTAAREHALAGNIVKMYRNTTFPQLSAVSRPDLYTTANFEGWTIDEEVIEFRRNPINTVLDRFKDEYDLFYVDPGTTLTAFSGSYRSPRLPTIYTDTAFRHAFPKKNTNELQGSTVIVLGVDQSSINVAKHARDLGASVSIVAGKHPQYPVINGGINFAILHPPYSIGEKDLVAFIRSDRTETETDIAAPLYYYCDIIIIGPAQEPLVSHDQRSIGRDSTYVQRDSLVDHTLTLTGQMRFHSGSESGMVSQSTG